MTSKRDQKLITTKEENTNYNHNLKLLAILSDEIDNNKDYNFREILVALNIVNSVVEETSLETYKKVTNSYLTRASRIKKIMESRKKTRVKNKEVQKLKSLK